MNNKKLFSYIAQVFIGNQSDGDYLDKQLLVFWHVCIPFLAWMYYKINSYWRFLILGAAFSSYT